ncbi:uncharacterized protein LOC144375010 [Ictidomys tridecemlineatus]
MATAGRGLAAPSSARPASRAGPGCPACSSGPLAAPPHSPPGWRPDPGSVSRRPPRAAAGSAGGHERGEKKAQFTCCYRCETSLGARRMSRGPPPQPDYNSHQPRRGLSGSCGGSPAGRPGATAPPPCAAPRLVGARWSPPGSRGRLGFVVLAVNLRPDLDRAQKGAEPRVGLPVLGRLRVSLGLRAAAAPAA